MNQRVIAVVIMGLAVLVFLVNVARVPPQAWRYVDDWVKVNIGVSFMSLVAMLLVAYWVHSDYEESFDRSERPIVRDARPRAVGYKEVRCGNCVLFATGECKAKETKPDAEACSDYIGKIE